MPPGGFFSTATVAEAHGYRSMYCRATSYTKLMKLKKHEFSQQKNVNI